LFEHVPSQKYPCIRQSRKFLFMTKYFSIIYWYTKRWHVKWQGAGVVYSEKEHILSKHNMMIRIAIIRLDSNDNCFVGKEQGPNLWKLFSI
jgi:hypothetical protein